jgi:hemoglobin-like flavoprotein
MVECVSLSVRGYFEILKSFSPLFILILQLIKTLLMACKQEASVVIADNFEKPGETQESGGVQLTQHVENVVRTWAEVKKDLVGNGTVFYFRSVFHLSLLSRLQVDVQLPKTCGEVNNYFIINVKEKNCKSEVLICLFRLFSENPELKYLFSFTSKMKSEEMKKENPALIRQAKLLMTMIDYAIRCLGNLNELVPKLKTLGKRHFVKYNVKPEHFKVGSSLVLPSAFSSLTTKSSPSSSPQLPSHIIIWLQ